MPEQYPADLATAAKEAWPRDAARALPKDLAHTLSTCFQASMLREEGRSITFRLLFGDAETLPRCDDVVRQVLPFETPRPFTAGELRRLTAASEFYRTLIGVACHDDTPVIWGLVHTGPKWSREVLGGRTPNDPLPRQLVVHVQAPGEISVHCGDEPVATLRSGTIEQESVDVFESEWLPRHFAGVRSEVLALHEQDRREAGDAWAALDPDFIRVLAQNVVRRTIGVMRQQRHGGTLLFLPPAADDRRGLPLATKYSMANSEARRRFRSLLVRTMNTLAAEGAAASESVGWLAYSTSRSADLAELDGAIFELGHLFADLSSVDGALVLTQGFEILGFGSEISGDLPSVTEVWRSLDREGQRLRSDDPDTFGTRHRSVFRLCAARPDVVAVVVSQDGQVRFVRNLDGRVVYFNHRVLGAL